MNNVALLSVIMLTTNIVTELHSMDVQEADPIRLVSVYECCAKKEYDPYPLRDRTCIENYIFCASPRCCLPKVGCHPENCEKSCLIGSAGLPACGLVEKYLLCMEMYAQSSGTYLSCNKIWFPSSAVSYNCSYCGLSESCGQCVAWSSSLSCIAGAVCVSCVALNYVCKKCTSNK